MAKGITTAVISKKKRELFLEALAGTGKVNEAAHAAGYTNTSYLQRIRREDEEFARDWDLALQAAGDILEAEAVRRAVEGTRRYIYYKGDVVGEEIVYSDQLLMFLLKGIRPATYRDRASASANVNVKFGVAVLPMTAPNADAWEARAVGVHEGQQPIVLEDLETDDTPRVARGS